MTDQKACAGCALCGYGDDGQYKKNPPASVPTISYLNDGEWERV